MFLLKSLSAVFFVFTTIGEIGDGLKVGDKAKDFSLKDVSGAMVSLSDNKDAKGYILVFTCNTCPYSVSYEDRIIALHDKYASQGYPVVAIQPNSPKKSPGDSFEKMQQRSEDKNFPFPYLMDKTQEITRTYGATNTPHVYVLQRQEDDGFQIKYIGAIDNNSRDASAATEHYVEKAVDALLEGKEVGNTKTKAIGCTIKWAS